VTTLIKERAATGGSPSSPTTLERVRRAAWLLIVVVDAGLLLWGAMAALVPAHLV
jgi:hypothetical protein